MVEATADNLWSEQAFVHQVGVEAALKRVKALID